MQRKIAGLAAVVLLASSTAAFACGMRASPTASTSTSATPVQTAEVPSATATR
jgi:ABC-type glycerol-3-phosphate transport system substrate-binding protein